MIPIDAQLFVQRLQRQEPRSGLAGYLSQVPTRTLSRERLDQWVEDYQGQGRPLTSTEARELQHVYTVMAAPGLFGETEVGQATALSEVTKVKASSRPKRPSTRAVPAFSHVGAPRHLSGQSVKGAKKGWTVNLQDVSVGMPVLSPDAQTLYAHDDAGVVHAVQAASGKSLWELELGVRQGGMMALHPAGRRLFTLCGDSFPKLVAIDTQTQELLWSQPLGNGAYGTTENCAPVVLSPDGRQVFTRNDAGLLQAFDSGTGAVQWTAKVWTDSGFRSYFSQYPVVSPDGSKVLVPDGKKHLRAFDTKSGELLWSAECVADGASGVITPDGALYIGLNYDSIRAFDLDTGALSWERTLTYSVPPETGPTLTSDGKSVVAFDSEESLIVLDAVSGKLQREVSYIPADGDGGLLRGYPTLLAGDQVAIVMDEEARYFAVDLEAGTSRQVGQGDECLFTLSTSPDGRFVYQGSSNAFVLRALELDL